LSRREYHDQRVGGAKSEYHVSRFGGVDFPVNAISRMAIKVTMPPIASDTVDK
jgi:hypothetical protein